LLCAELLLRPIRTAMLARDGSERAMIELVKGGMRRHRGGGCTNKDNFRIQNKSHPSAAPTRDLSTRPVPQPGRRAAPTWKAKLGG
jgi:hypothetical protein